jgi:hypothetical protein
MLVATPMLVATQMITLKFERWRAVENGGLIVPKPGEPNFLRSPWGLAVKSAVQLFRHFTVRQFAKQLISSFSTETAAPNAACPTLVLRLSIPAVEHSWNWLALIVHLPSVLPARICWAEVSAETQRSTD